MIPCIFLKKRWNPFELNKAQNLKKANPTDKISIGIFSFFIISLSVQVSCLSHGFGHNKSILVIILERLERIIGYLEDNGCLFVVLVGFKSKINIVRAE